MSQIIKIWQLLEKNEKKRLVFIGFLLLMGTFFEMVGLGVLIPGLGLILNSNIAADYPALKPLATALSGLSRLQIVMWGLGLMVGVYFLKAVFLVYTAWRQADFSTRLSARLSRDLFRGYLLQPYAFHLNRNSAHMVRNIHGEVDQLSAVSQAMINLSTELSAVIGVACMLILAEPVGAVIVIFFLGASSAMFYLLTKNRILRWGKARLGNDQEIAKNLNQGLGAVKDVKLLARESFFLNKFDSLNDSKASVLTRQITLTQVPRLYLEVLAVIGMAGLVLMMMVQGKPLNLLIPTIGIFVAAAFRMIPSVNRVMSSLQTVRYSGPVINTLVNEFKLIRYTPSEYHQQGQIRFTREISIQDLSFNYEKSHKDAIKNMNIVIAKNKTTGIIGASGSGKSTLVDIILGLLKPGHGNVFIDGVAITVNLRQWQNLIGYVPQTIFLTDDSIRRNIAFGVPENEIDDATVLRALEAAQLRGFVAGLPEGLDTVVGERGVKLSGGQRQRIGIARALYHDPEVLFLDEATSALDTATEKEVMNAVSALHGSKTIVIVAHRLTTVAGCDWLYKLNQGILVDEGTPNTLLTKAV